MNKATPPRIDREAAASLIGPLTDLVIRAGRAILAVNRATLKVDGLKAGRYTFFCPIDHHRAAGMQGMLVVGGSSSPAPRGTLPGVRSICLRQPWPRCSRRHSPPS